MKSAVLVFPGINRERDMARALKLAAGHEPAMVWHADTELPRGTDLVVLPGGFSYGDYLRCGAIAARAPVMDAVRSFAGNGGLVLGVCNGFQILCESALLPGILMRNARLKFICHDVNLRVERSDTPFTRGYNAGQVIRVPVAHGEGNYAADENTIRRLEGEGRVLYRYCSASGEVGDTHNINGAAQSIAGIINERGNVLGMMPHPENHVEDIMGCTDGAVGAAHDVLDVIFRMRHHAEHIAALVDDAGDRLRRAVDVVGIADLAARRAIAIQHTSLALEAANGVLVGGVVALAMRDGHAD